VPSVTGAPHIVHFYELDGRIVAQPWSDNLLWESTDGFEWTAAVEPEAPWSDDPDAPFTGDHRVPHKTPTGLALTVTRYALPDYHIWVSPDGTDWISVEGPSTELTSTDAPIFSVAGESIFLLLLTREHTALWVRTLPIDQNES
jgi:hypothetical protein